MDDLEGMLHRGLLQHNPSPHDPQKQIQGLVMFALQIGDLLLEIFTVLLQLCFKGGQIPIQEKPADGFHRAGQSPKLLEQEDGWDLLRSVETVIGFFIPIGRDNDPVLIIIAKQLGRDVAKLGHLSDGVHSINFQGGRSPSCDAHWKHRKTSPPLPLPLINSIRHTVGRMSIWMNAPIYHWQCIRKNDIFRRSAQKMNKC